MIIDLRWEGGLIWNSGAGLRRWTLETRENHGRLVVNVERSKGGVSLSKKWVYVLPTSLWFGATAHRQAVESLL